jgi:hypothetical protein
MTLHVAYRFQEQIILLRTWGSLVSHFDLERLFGLFSEHPAV